MLLLELSSTYPEMIENTFSLIIIKDTRTFCEAYGVQLCFPSAICPKNALPRQSFYLRGSSFEENLANSEGDNEFKRYPRFVESLLHRMLFLSTVSSSNIVHALFKTRSRS